MKKNVVNGMVVGAIAVSLLAGCGSTSSSESASASSSAVTSESTSAVSTTSSSSTELYSETTEGTSPDELADVTANDSYSIGVSYDYLNDFMSYVVNGTEAAADDLGVTVTVQDAEFDSSKQLQQVENFIASGCDAIIIKPCDVTACQAMYQECQDAGIPFVCVNDEPQSGKDSYVGSTSRDSGVMQAEYLNDTLPDGGNVAILEGDMTNSASIARTEGVEETLNDNFEVVSVQEAGWMRDEAISTTEDWINSGMDLAAIVANNDEMAIGAAMVLAENNITDVLVCGIDASEAGLEALKEGTLSFTVFQDGYTQGYTAVLDAVALANGEEVAKYYAVPYEPVTQDQADEYLEKLNG